MTTAHLHHRLDRMPMLRIAAPLAVGILLSEHFTLPLWFLAGAFVLLGLLALLFGSVWSAVWLVVVAGFASGQLRAPQITVPRSVRCHFEICVEGIPADRGRYTTAEGVVTAWRTPDGVWHAARDRVLVRSDSLTPLDGGERIRCVGVVRPFRGGVSGYDRLMNRRGVAGTIYLSERQIVERLVAHDAQLHLYAARRVAQLRVRGDAGAVVRAMTAGDRSAIGPQLRADYARSGMAHLLAVSGLHTGMVFLLINIALWWIPLLRRGHLLRNLICIAVVWLYVASAGFPPSALRAAVMCTLLQGALISTSQYVGLNALGAAAVGMLLWNPAWLGDVSFQLSFLAVAAILAWGTPLRRRLQTGIRVVDWVLDLLVIGLVASVATAPLISQTFGIIPILGILLNPLVIPLAGVVVVGGVLWLVLPVSFLAPAIRFVTEEAAEGLNGLARFVASMPYGVVEYTLAEWQTACIYLLFLCATGVMWCVEPKKSVHLPP